MKPIKYTTQISIDRTTVAIAFRHPGLPVQSWDFKTENDLLVQIENYLDKMFPGTDWVVREDGTAMDAMEIVNTPVHEEITTRIEPLVGGHEITINGMPGYVSAVSANSDLHEAEVRLVRNATGWDHFTMTKGEMQNDTGLELNTWRKQPKISVKVEGTKAVCEYGSYRGTAHELAAMGLDSVEIPEIPVTERRKVFRKECRKKTDTAIEGMKRAMECAECKGTGFVTLFSSRTKCSRGCDDPTAVAAPDPYNDGVADCLDIIERHGTQWTYWDIIEALRKLKR